MPFFLSPRFAMLLLVALPLATGAVVHPRGTAAFLLGAWSGVLIVGPPLMITLWVLRVITLGDLLKPLMRLPILILATVACLYFSGVDIGLGGQVVGGGAALLALRQARKLAFF